METVDLRSVINNNQINPDKRYLMLQYYDIMKWYCIWCLLFLNTER